MGLQTPTPSRTLSVMARGDGAENRWCLENELLRGVFVIAGPLRGLGCGREDHGSAERAGGPAELALFSGRMPGGVEEELEFGVAAADSLCDPVFDEPFRGGAVAGRGERLQAGQ